MVSVFVDLGFRQDLKEKCLSLRDKLTQERKGRLLSAQVFSQDYKRSSKTKWRLRTIVFSLVLSEKFAKQFKR